MASVSVPDGAASGGRHEGQQGAVLFDPARLPPPDEDGWFMHPDLGAIYGDDEVTQDEANRRLALRGWESAYVSGEHLIKDGSTEYEGVREWNPDPPPGDWNRSWQLISVFDSEDGPYAQFVRPLVAHQPSSGQQELPEELLAEAERLCVEAR